MQRSVRGNPEKSKERGVIRVKSEEEEGGFGFYLFENNGVYFLG